MGSSSNLNLVSWKILSFVKKASRATRKIPVRLPSRETRHNKKKQNQSPMTLNVCPIIKAQLVREFITEWNAKRTKRSER